MEPRHDHRAVLLVDRDRLGVGADRGAKVFHAARATPRSVSRGLCQGWRPAPHPRLEYVLGALAEVGSPGLGHSSVRRGAGCDHSGKPLCRVGRQRALSGLCRPSGVEDAACHPTSCLESRMANTPSPIPAGGACLVESLGVGRPWPVLQGLVPGHRGTGLASAAARQFPREISARGLASLAIVEAGDATRGTALARPLYGLPESTGPTGLHAAGLLGGRTRRTLAGGDGPPGGRGRCLLVWLARLDRTRLQANQTRRLAMAAHTHERPGSGRAFVVGGGGRDLVAAVGGRRGGGRNAARDYGRRTSDAHRPSTALAYGGRVSSGSNRDHGCVAPTHSPPVGPRPPRTLARHVAPNRDAGQRKKPTAVRTPLPEYRERGDLGLSLSRSTGRGETWGYPSPGVPGEGRPGAIPLQEYR